MRWKKRGLTLIELVVAMALFIVLILMVMRGLGSYLQANTTQQQEMLLQQNFRYAIDTLSNDARQATLITTPNAVAGVPCLDERVRLTLPVPAPGTGTQTVVYSMEKKTGGSTYFLARTVENSAQVQPVTEEIPQLFKVYFIVSGSKLYVIMVGRVTSYGRTRSVALSSIVCGRN